MAYPNLKAEMGRFGVTKKEVAECADISNVTLYHWMNDANESAFPMIKAKRVRDKFFPTLSLDYLFADGPIVDLQTGRTIQQDPSSETV